MKKLDILRAVVEAIVITLFLAELVFFMWLFLPAPRP